MAVMFRREVIERLGGFKGLYTPAEDYEILLYAARRFSSAHHRNVVAHYRRHPENTSRKGAVMLRALHRVMNAQRMVVEAHPELEVARRKGLTYWRDHFGAVTIKEVYTHLRRCELIAALRASGTLFWYVRTRLLVLPWKHRKRVWNL